VSFIRNAMVSAAAIIALAGTGYGGWRALDGPAQKAADPGLANVMTLALARIP
jgi:hypothetical protein